MSDTTDDQQSHDDRLTTLQAVVDRVGAWQGGAPEGTVAAELRAGIAEAGLTVSDDEVARLADAIQDEHGRVSVAEALG
ncbi:hypothetical protein [Nocardioides taihuensis]|uniref:DUF3349 domain-containing protein n=1 Tax=Nocardioides taihuensis TaxID=1835606 RepID=A0ABW0BID5_9ACTN